MSLPIDLIGTFGCSKFQTQSCVFALSMYFFGHHPANRFEFTRGRDLVVEPGPASGPINFLAYPLLEIEGKPQKVKTLFLFRRTTCDAKERAD